MMFWMLILSIPVIPAILTVEHVLPNWDQFGVWMIAILYISLIGPFLCRLYFDWFVGYFAIINLIFGRGATANERLIYHQTKLTELTS